MHRAERSRFPAGHASRDACDARPKCCSAPATVVARAQRASCPCDTSALLAAFEWGPQGHRISVGGGAQSFDPGAQPGEDDTQEDSPAILPPPVDSAPPPPTGKRASGNKKQILIWLLAGAALLAALKLLF